MYSGNKNINNILLMKRYFATYVVSNLKYQSEHVIYLLECIWCEMQYLGKPKTGKALYK